MTQKFTKWQKYSGNGLYRWGTAKVFEKLLYYDVDIWDMTKICGKWLNYLKNGLINC